MKGKIAIALAAILWGIDGVVLTPGLFNLDVSFVVFLLHTTAFVIMNLFLYKEYKHLTSLTQKQMLNLTAIALAGGVIGTLAIVKALFLVNFTQLSVVVLLQKLQPVFAIVLAAVILKEKLTKKFTLLAGLAIVASYIMTFGLTTPNLTTGANTFYAALLAVVAAAAFGFATVLGKMAVKTLNFKTVTFYRFGLTSIIMGLYVLLFSSFTFTSLTVENWLIILIIALTTGSGALFLYYYGLRLVKASLATILELFFPLTVIVLDYVINGTVLSLVQWIGVILLITSVYKLSE